MDLTSRINIDLAKATNYIPMGYWVQPVAGDPKKPYYRITDMGIPMVKIADGTALGYSVWVLQVDVSDNIQPSSTNPQWKLVESADFIYMQQAYIERLQAQLISAVTVNLREDPSSDVTAGFSGIQGPYKDQPALWAGGTYAEAISGVAKAIIRHDGSVKFEEGVIAGWGFTPGRIGKAQTSTGLPTATGLSLHDTFIKFSDEESSVFLGTNVLPASTGMVGMGRITNTNSNIRKIGMYFDMAGADTSFWDGSSNNIAMYINRGVIAGAKFNGVNHNLGAAGYTIGKETVVCIYTTNDYIVKLPANPEPWEFKWVFGINNQNFTLSGNGKNIWSPFSGSVSSLTFKSGVVVYTGQQWAIFS